MRELHMYDFDGTLFRSPGRPDGWKGGWWSHASSLDRPFIPRKPGKEWWVAEVVASALQSIQDPNVYTVLMTGRLAFKGNFRTRVPELLLQQGIQFDETLLCTGNGTEQWKMSMFDRLVDAHGFEVVRIWEDREAHAANFVRLLESKGCEVDLTLVKVPTPRAKHIASKHLRNQ